MTRYRYFLLSSVLQFPYSFNVQQYRFFFAPQALGFAPTQKILPSPMMVSLSRGLHVPKHGAGVGLLVRVSRLVTEQQWLKWFCEAGRRKHRAENFRPAADPRSRRRRTAKI